jgi:hypothetical protein
MASKIKVDTLETADGTGSIALSNQLSGMTVASLPTTGTLPALDGSSLTGVAPTKATIDALGIAASSITGALPVIDGSNLTNMAAGGKVLQVVNSSTTSAFSTTSTTLSDVLTCTITPTLSSSKVLVMFSSPYIRINQVSDTYASIWLYVDSTAVTNFGTYLFGDVYPWGTANFVGGCFTVNNYHTPNTTSAITYKMKGKSGHSSTTFKMNASGGYGQGQMMTMTLMEIGA